jgi:hypothetical protein
MSSQFRSQQYNISNTQGQALAGASIAVLTQPATVTTQPGSPLATIFNAATSNAATLTAASWLAGVISFTFSGSVPADVVAGSWISVSGVNPTGYNGIWQVTGVSGLVVTVTTPYTLTAIANPGTYVSGGTVATSALPNPFFSDVLGNFYYYAAAGVYTVQIYDTQGRITNQLVFADQNVVAGGGSGSVTSIAVTMPSIFTVTGSPITGAGTIAVTLANENANQGFFGPTSGGAAAPTFRSLVAADLPAGTGTVTSVAATLTVPASLFGSSVAGSPITAAGTLAFTITLNNQAANTFLAGPASGASAPPTFRTLTAADIPQTVTSLTSANILALDGTPITLVPAPGVGFRIVPLLIQIVFFGGSVAYTDAGGAVSISAGSMAQALTNNNIFLTTVSPNKAIQQIGSFSGSDVAGNPPTDDNAPLVISKITNNFAAGNGTAKITVQYLILPTT